MKLLEIHREHCEREDYFFGYKFKASILSENEEEYRAFLASSEAKEKARLEMAWAVPDEAAIDLIVEHSPRGVVEIGAGGGYWCSLLKERGLTVRPYDLKPGGFFGNHYVKRGTVYTPISCGSPRKARLHPEMSLLLCWPPYGESMATESLQWYAGDTLVYVGEHYGGCCADDEFFATVANEWEEIAEYNIPQWPYLHDYLTVYRRRNT